MHDDIFEKIKIILLERKRPNALLEIFAATVKNPKLLRVLLLKKTNKFWQSIVDARDEKNINILMLILIFLPDAFTPFLNFLTKNRGIIGKEIIQTLLLDRNDDKKDILALVEEKPLLLHCFFNFVINNDLKVEGFVKKILNDKVFCIENKYLVAKYCAEHVTSSELKEVATKEQRKYLYEIWQERIVTLNPSIPENRTYLNQLFMQHPLALLKNCPKDYYSQVRDSKAFVPLFKVWLSQVIKAYAGNGSKRRLLFMQKESIALRELLHCVNNSEALDPLAGHYPILRGEALAPLFEALRYHTHCLINQQNTKNLYPSLDALRLN